MYEEKNTQQLYYRRQAIGEIGSMLFKGFAAVSTVGALAEIAFAKQKQDARYQKTFNLSERGQTLIQLREYNSEKNTINKYLSQTQRHFSRYLQGKKDIEEKGESKNEFEFSPRTLIGFNRLQSMYRLKRTIAEVITSKSYKSFIRDTGGKIANIQLGPTTFVTINFEKDKVTYNFNNKQPFEVKTGQYNHIIRKIDADSTFDKINRETTDLYFQVNYKDLLSATKTLVDKFQAHAEKNKSKIKQFNPPITQEEIQRTDIEVATIYSDPAKFKSLNQQAIDNIIITTVNMVPQLQRGKQTTFDMKEYLKIRTWENTKVKGATFSKGTLKIGITQLQETGLQFEPRIFIERKIPVLSSLGNNLYQIIDIHPEKSTLTYRESQMRHANQWGVGNANIPARYLTEQRRMLRMQELAIDLMDFLKTQ